MSTIVSLILYHSETAADSQPPCPSCELRASATTLYGSHQISSTPQHRCSITQPPPCHAAAAHKRRRSSPSTRPFRGTWSCLRTAQRSRRGITSRAVPALARRFESAPAGAPSQQVQFRRSGPACKVDHLLEHRCPHRHLAQHHPPNEELCLCLSRDAVDRAQPSAPCSRRHHSAAAAAFSPSFNLHTHRSLLLSRGGTPELLLGGAAT